MMDFDGLGPRGAAGSVPAASKGNVRSASSRHASTGHDAGVKSLQFSDWSSSIDYPVKSEPWSAPQLYRLLSPSPWGEGRGLHHSYTSLLEPSRRNLRATPSVRSTSVLSVGPVGASSDEDAVAVDVMPKYFHTSLLEPSRRNLRATPSARSTTSALFDWPVGASSDEDAAAVDATPKYFHTSLLEPSRRNLRATPSARSTISDLFDWPVGASASTATFASAPLECWSVAGDSASSTWPSPTRQTGSVVGGQHHQRAGTDDEMTYYYAEGEEDSMTPRAGKERGSNDMHCPMQCGEGFDTIDLMDAHLAADHAHACLWLSCGKDFGSREQLMRHAQVEHFRTCPVKGCGEEGLQFESSKKLRAHVREMHASEAEMSFPEATSGLVRPGKELDQLEHSDEKQPTLTDKDGCTDTPKMPCKVAMASAPRVALSALPKTSWKQQCDVRATSRHIRAQTKKQRCRETLHLVLERRVRSVVEAAKTASRTSVKPASTTSARDDATNSTTVAPEMLEAVAFPIVWEHGVLPFLAELMPMWTSRTPPKDVRAGLAGKKNPNSDSDGETTATAATTAPGPLGSRALQGEAHVISATRVRASSGRNKSGSASRGDAWRIQIMTLRPLSLARRLTVAAHVRDILPPRYRRGVSFSFGVGCVARSNQPGDGLGARDPMGFDEALAAIRRTELDRRPRTWARGLGESLPDDVCKPRNPGCYVDWAGPGGRGVDDVRGADDDDHVAAAGPTTSLSPSSSSPPQQAGTRVRRNFGPRMGDSVGCPNAPGHGRQAEMTGTLGPRVVVDGYAFWLCNFHPFVDAWRATFPFTDDSESDSGADSDGNRNRRAPTLPSVQHPAPADRLRCVAEAHDALEGLVLPDLELGKMAATSGLDLATSRVSHDQYWDWADLREARPRVVTDWTLVSARAYNTDKDDDGSSGERADTAGETADPDEAALLVETPNILRRFPSATEVPARDVPVTKTLGGIPRGAVVVSTGRTSGFNRGVICEVPAYVSGHSDGGNGIGIATREWFVEELVSEREGDEDVATRAATDGIHNDSDTFSNADNADADDDAWIRGGMGCPGDSGQPVVAEESNALVGQVWGRNVYWGPGPRVAYFTPIEDIFDDVAEKCGLSETPRLPLGRSRARRHRQRMTAAEGQQAQDSGREAEGESTELLRASGLYDDSDEVMSGDFQLFPESPGEDSRDSPPQRSFPLHHHGSDFDRDTRTDHESEDDADDTFFPVYPLCRPCYDLRAWLESRRSSRESLRSVLGMRDGGGIGARSEAGDRENSNVNNDNANMAAGPDALGRRRRSNDSNSDGMLDHDLTSVEGVSELATPRDAQPLWLLRRVGTALGEGAAAAAVARPRAAAAPAWADWSFASATVGSSAPAGTVAAAAAAMSPPATTTTARRASAATTPFQLPPSPSPFALYYNFPGTPQIAASPYPLGITLDDEEGDLAGPSSPLAAKRRRPEAHAGEAEALAAGLDGAKRRRVQ